MKSDRNVLWSTDIFGARAAASSSAAASLDPDHERAFGRYGRPVLQDLARQSDRQARLQDTGERIAAADASFDIDHLRAAFAELVRRDALELVERDPKSGNHLYRLTRSGWIMAA